MTIINIFRATTVVFAFTILTLMGHLANAATFTNEGAWQAAAGAYATEDFESLGLVGTNVSSLTSIGVDFATINDVYDGSSGGPLFGSSSLINIWPFDGNQLQPFSFTSSNGNAITAVGVWNASGEDGLFLDFYDAGDMLMESVFIVASLTQPIFGGIVNNAGASRVEIRSDGTANGWMAIDNLQVTIAIPEPTSLALLVLSTLGSFTARRCRQLSCF